MSSQAGTRPSIRLKAQSGRMARVVLPDGWAKPRGYSNAVVLPFGRPLFIAGMIGWDGNQQFVSDDFVDQFRQALKNIKACAEAAGSSVECIGSMTIYVVSKYLYAQRLRELGQTYRDIFGRHYPAMTLVEVKALLEDRALVEIEARGVVPELPTLPAS